MSLIRQTADQMVQLASDLLQGSARKMREEGKTYAQIATELGISRARAHQLCDGVEPEAQPKIRKKAAI